MADLTGMMQAAAGAAGGDDNLFIEDVFSCFLYTGNGSTQTITNGIDLDGEGGLVWAKSRGAANSHILTDTVRGAANTLITNSALAQNAAESNSLSSFNSNGFSLNASARINALNDPTVSWTFRKAPKFFDVVTYTGNGVAGRTVAHNLGSTPGWLIVKKTSGTDNWFCWHRNLTDATFRLLLNFTAAETQQTNAWNSTAPTSTVFTLGDNANVNESGATYVAYLFAHDAGGFGDDGTENAITCGSYSNPSPGNAVVTLGYEPQYVMIKRIDVANPWFILDTMRGMTVGGVGQYLQAESSLAEASSSGFMRPTATGFQLLSGNPGDYIFIAIRRGPMKTPTAGTEVFATSTAARDTNITGVNFPVDMFMCRDAGEPMPFFFCTRLTNAYLEPSAEVDEETGLANTFGYKLGTPNQDSFRQNFFGDATNMITEMFRRAPGFFDVVCYTGTSSARTVAHNLAVVPELMIIKKRSGSEIDGWFVYSSELGASSFVALNLTNASAATATLWNATTPTSSVFSLGNSTSVNASGSTYVAYLFASLAGVQDIGSYTGNGTSLTVTTGFQPRFIMVKRTNSTGNWIVGDSARGLVAGDDPALFFNSTAAETTGQDWVDVSATGFTVNETALNANVSTGVYLYWAIS